MYILQGLPMAVGRLFDRRPVVMRTSLVFSLLAPAAHIFQSSFFLWNSAALMTDSHTFYLTWFFLLTTIKVLARR